MKLDISKQILVVRIMKNFDLRMFHISRWYTELNPTDLHQYIAKCNFQILMVQVKATRGNELTHCGIMMPYGDIDLSQHWLR